MSAALRLQNKRKTTSVLSLEESAPKDLGTSSPKSVDWLFYCPDVQSLVVLDEVSRRLM
jgi:hypothetical protein